MRTAAAADLDGWQVAPLHQGEERRTGVQQLDLRCAHALERPGRDGSPDAGRGASANGSLRDEGDDLAVGRDVVVGADEHGVVTRAADDVVDSQRAVR
jgi:hypothetical protein